MPRYRWEPGAGVSGRYRDTATGRFLSPAVVRRELDAYLDNNDAAARALAGMLRNRQVSLVDWELAMRRQIKHVHINAVVLERGGYANMRPSDWGRVGAMVRRQYGYLTQFGVDIADGRQPMDGRLDWRAQLYAQAGRNSYYQSAHANVKEGITHVRSIKHARDSCRDCVALDGKWFRISDPAYMLPGDRQCLSNCRCSEQLAALDDGAYVSVEAI